MIKTTMYLKKYKINPLNAHLENNGTDMEEKKKYTQSEPFSIYSLGYVKY